MFLKSSKPGAASLLCIQAQRATEPRRASRGRYRRKPFQALRNAKKSYPHPLPSKGLGRSRGAPVDHEAPATARDLRRGIDKERYKDAVAWSLVPVLGREWAPPCVRRISPKESTRLDRVIGLCRQLGGPTTGGSLGRAWDTPGACPSERATGLAVSCMYCWDRSTWSTLRWGTVPRFLPCERRGSGDSSSSVKDSVARWLQSSSPGRAHSPESPEKP